MDNSNSFRGKPNIIAEKSFEFSVIIIRMYQWITKNHKDISPLSKQVLRSGTSVGANIEEAVGGVSKKEFIVKLSISYKEARETKYWLRLLFSTGYTDEKMYYSIVQDCDEILKLLTAILKTSKGQ